MQSNHSEGEEKPDMKITRVAVDIAKSVFDKPRLHQA